MMVAHCVGELQEGKSDADAPEAMLSVRNPRLLQPEQASSAKVIDFCSQPGLLGVMILLELPSLSRYACSEFFQNAVNA
jgi:hypothetical protein